MQGVFTSEKSQEEIKVKDDFEARQNVEGFFSVLLEVVMQNPELCKKVFNEKNNENNRGTNLASKAE